MTVSLSSKPPSASEVDSPLPRQSRRRQLLASGMASGALGLGAVCRPARAQDTKIVLGQSAVLSGVSAQLGIQYRDGAKLGFERANAQGGIHGRTVELRTLDDAYDPERCAQNTRGLLADNVFALFGYVGTVTSLAALPLAVKDKAPFLAPLTGAMALREPFVRQAFHIRASYQDEAALTVRQLIEQGKSRVAVLHQNDAYGKAGLDGLVQALSKANLTPVALATVERNSVDVAAAVKTLTAAGATAMVLVTAYKTAAAFILAARQAGYGGLYYNMSFVGTAALARELGKSAAGVVVSQVLPSPYTTSRPLAREFAEAIKAGGNTVEVNYSSLEGYLAARVVVEGLRRAGKALTRDGFISAMESIRGQDFGGFEVNFGTNDHVGSHFVEKSMLTADGRVLT